MTEYRKQRTEIRRQKAEDRAKKTEDRCQKTKNRKQRTEIRRQNLEKWGDLGFLGKITIIRTGFLQNKANLRKSQVSVSQISTRAYERKIILDTW